MTKIPKSSAKTRRAPFRIGILGLGNLMRSDDALGMLTLAELQGELRVADDANNDLAFIEGGTLGLDLLESMRGITHLLAIDAVDAGARPGALLRFYGEELANLQVSKSVHLLGFSDLISVLRLLNAAPEEIALLGLQPESTEWGTELSLPVAAGQTRLIQAIHQQIDAWRRGRLSLFQEFQNDLATATEDLQAVAK